MVFGGCAPGGAGVVDENIDMAQLRQRFVRQAVDFRFLRGVCRDPVGFDAKRLQVGLRGLQFVA